MFFYIRITQVWGYELAFPDVNASACIHGPLESHIYILIFQISLILTRKIMDLKPLIDFFLYFSSPRSRWPEKIIECPIKGSVVVLLLPQHITFLDHSPTKFILFFETAVHVLYSIVTLVSRISESRHEEEELKFISLLPLMTQL